MEQQEGDPSQLTTTDQPSHHQCIHRLSRHQDPNLILGKDGSVSLAAVSSAAGTVLVHSGTGPTGPSGRSANLTTVSYSTTTSSAAANHNFLSAAANEPFQGVTVNKPFQGVTVNKPFQGVTVNEPFQGVTVNEPFQSVFSPPRTVESARQIERDTTQRSIANQGSSLGIQSQVKSLLYGPHILNRGNLILTGTVPRGVKVFFNEELDNRAFLEVLETSCAERSQGIIYLCAVAVMYILPAGNRRYSELQANDLFLWGQSESWRQSVVDYFKAIGEDQSIKFHTPYSMVAAVAKWVGEGVSVESSFGYQYAFMGTPQSLLCVSVVTDREACRG